MDRCGLRWYVAVFDGGARGWLVSRECDYEELPPLITVCDTDGDAARTEEVSDGDIEMSRTLAPSHNLGGFV